MIFSSSPYFPLVKRLRRLLGDEENPAAAFKLSAIGTTNVKITTVYTPPTNLAPAYQSLIISSADTTPIVQPVSFDLTQFSTIREMLLSLNNLTFGNSVITAEYINNPLRTNNPLDLVPGVFPINAAPKVFYTRHYLSDEDLQDDLIGALLQHNSSYTFDPTQATQTVTLPSGQTGYAYPDQSAYPYPGLASKIIYLCPQNEGYFVCMLAAAFALYEICTRYSRLPVIQTEDAYIDRGIAVERMMELAQQYSAQYEQAVDAAGLTFQINDLTRISSRTGVLSQTPELNIGIANNIYGLRWLSASVPNTVQPVTQKDAHAYDSGILSQYLATPDIGLRP